VRRRVDGLKTQRDSLREQLVGIARRILDEAVSTPFLTRLGIVASVLRVTRADSSFCQSIRRRSLRRARQDGPSIKSVSQLPVSADSIASA
jgi:hypothetical protein